MNNLGEKIKELREDTGISQNMLGEKLGVSDTIIGRWENNINEPKATYIARLASFFKVSTDFLLDTENVGAIRKPAETLSEQEKEIVSNYRKCTKVQQAQALGYIEAFAQINEQQNNSNKSIG